MARDLHDGIWLRVTDDGSGFDPSEAGFGLIGVRERTVIRRPSCT